MQRNSPGCQTCKLGTLNRVLIITGSTLYQLISCKLRYFVSAIETYFYSIIGSLLILYFRGVREVEQHEHASLEASL